MIFWIVTSYLTSLIYCLSNTEWLAMIVLHVLLAPLGVIHGTFIWFGVSWF
jgi:hypothetical protein